MWPKVKDSLCPDYHVLIVHFHIFTELLYIIIQLIPLVSQLHAKMAARVLLSLTDMNVPAHQDLWERIVNCEVSVSPALAKTEALAMT